MDNLSERVEALEQHLRTLAAHTHTVEWRLRLWRRLACGLVVLLVLGLILSSSTAQEERTSEKHQTPALWRADLEDTLRKLREILTHVTIAKDDAGRREIILSGVNLRIVNGLGRTDCGTEDNPIPDCPNGLGNLIVGYNETRGDSTDSRMGSHNVVVGSQHNFSSFGGIVVGAFNEISGAFASVSGGHENTASGALASVSGGGTTRPAASALRSAGGVAIQPVALQLRSAGGVATRPVWTLPQSAAEFSTRLAGEMPQSAGGSTTQPAVPSRRSAAGARTQPVATLPQSVGGAIGRLLGRTTGEPAVSSQTS